MIARTDAEALLQIGMFSRATVAGVHLDLHADDREAEVARLLALGATLVAGHDEHGIRWTTLQDVEGNELCIA